MLKIDDMIQKAASLRGLIADRALRAKVMLRLSYVEEGVLQDNSRTATLIDTVLARLAPKSMIKTAGVLKTASAVECPRCHKPCTVVHLADGAAHPYCDGCRIAQ